MVVHFIKKLPIILVYGMAFASFTFHLNNISSIDLVPLSGKHMLFIKWPTGIYRIERAATNLQPTSIQFGSYQTRPNPTIPLTLPQFFQCWPSKIILQHLPCLAKMHWALWRPTCAHTNRSIVYQMITVMNSFQETHSEKIVCECLWLFVQHNPT